jgi:hypothetical protein
MADDFTTTEQTLERKVKIQPVLARYVEAIRNPAIPMRRRHQIGEHIDERLIRGLIVYN